MRIRQKGERYPGETVLGVKGCLWAELEVDTELKVGARGDFWLIGGGALGKYFLFNDLEIWKRA